MSFLEQFDDLPYFDFILSVGGLILYPNEWLRDSLSVLPSFCAASPCFQDGSGDS